MSSVMSHAFCPRFFSSFPDGGREPPFSDIDAVDGEAEGVAAGGAAEPFAATVPGVPPAVSFQRPTGAITGKVIAAMDGCAGSDVRLPGDT